MTATAPYLSIRDVNKVYGGRRGEATTALKSISCEVTQGEFLAILGPSGCGKSTLLQIVAGLIDATAGAVTLGGEAVTAPPPEMVYLFQQYSKSLLPWRTVEQNVALVFEVEAHEETRDRGTRAANICRWWGWRAFANTIHGNSPAACSSASPLRVRLPRSRACYCWTSHSARSMR